MSEDSIYSDIVRTLRRHGRRNQERLVSLTTVARSIGESHSDTLFYLERMQEQGTVELLPGVPGAGYAARLTEEERAS